MAAFNHIMLSDAVDNNRFSAEFFDPQYVFKPSNSFSWVPIGRILKKCEYGISISMNTDDQGYPIFRMNELDNCFALRPEKFAAIPNYIFEQYRLNENDVLFNRTNAFNFVGRTGIIKDQTDCTFASYLIRLIPDCSVVLPEYLTLYLNTQFGIGQIKRRAMRSINQANVSGSEVKKILIPLIDLKIQEEVADLVNTSYQKSKDGKASYTQAQKLLESELGMDKLCFDKPVGYTAQFSELELSRRSDPEYFDPVARSIISKVMEFEHVKLGSSFSVGNGFPWYSKKFLSDNSGEPVVRIRNIRPTHIDVDELTSIDPDYARKVGFSKANKGEIVVGMDGLKYFYASVLEGDCYVNQRVAHLKQLSNAKISSEYATFIINSRVGQAQLLRDMTIATTVGHITNRTIAKLLIPYVSDEFHDNITALVRTSIEKKQESKQLLAQAKARVEQLIEEEVQKSSFPLI
jgi:type I restriction enzyme, S subunit